MVPILPQTAIRGPVDVSAVCHLATPGFTST
jgi:hypothetical protein